MSQRQTGRSRAPRVSVPNDEQAIVSVEGKPMVAILCKLSATGGSVRLSKSFAPGTLAEITVKTASGNVTAAIEFLRPGVDGVAQAQAFRFLHMDPGDRERLEDTLDQMRKHGLGEKDSGGSLVDLSKRGLSLAKKVSRFSRVFSS